MNRIIIFFKDVDFRGAWREEGSEAKKAMDTVTDQLIPFMVTWQSKNEKFGPPNGLQNASCLKIVAERLCEEVAYEYATKNNSADISTDPEKQAKQQAYIAKFISAAALGIIQHDSKPKSAN